LWRQGTRSEKKREQDEGYRREDTRKGAKERGRRDRRVSAFLTCSWPARTRAVRSRCARPVTSVACCNVLCSIHLKNTKYKVLQYAMLQGYRKQRRCYQLQTRIQASPQRQRRTLTQGQMPLMHRLRMGAAYICFELELIWVALG
jgi:hypothetical protein